MNTTNSQQSYTLAKERYAALGIDINKAIATLEKTPISLHCWQTDDVMGFESNAGLSGGIQTTGNYPGRARTMGFEPEGMSEAQMKELSEAFGLAK